jgi:predicted TPR repeat methyltransferase
MPTSHLRSSGNPLADRRYSYAEASLKEGDAAAAADLAEQVLELAPAFAPAYALLGRARLALQDHARARAAFDHALALEPEDALGVQVELAQLGAVAIETALTPGYVRALFDDYAPRFDRHLVKGLNYCAPDLLFEAVRRVRAAQVKPLTFGRALDLGCGTGLVGQAFAGACQVLEGVDLSPAMLARARRTRLYAALHEADLATFVRDQAAGSANLVIAADVFVYLASLDEVHRVVHQVLGPGGLLAFTVQAHSGEGVVLGPDARYAHGEHYLRDLAARAGFEIASFDRVSTREDRGEPVPGFLVVLAR